MCKSPMLMLMLLLAASIDDARAEPAGDPSAALSEVSTLSLEGGSALLEGVAVGGSYILVALQPLGEGALAVFEATGTSAQVTFELSGEAAVVAGRAIGEVVEVAALAGGSALMLAGEMIAFVPDELSRSLHHRQRLTP